MEEALRYIEQAIENNVKVTSVSYKEICNLLIDCYKEGKEVREESVNKFCERICGLSRGGYIVMLGLTPLEVMMKYGKISFAIQYVNLLRQYENGLTRKDIILLKEMQNEVEENKDLYTSLSKLINILRGKYAC